MRRNCQRDCRRAAQEAVTHFGGLETLEPRTLMSGDGIVLDVRPVVTHSSGTQAIEYSYTKRAERKHDVPAIDDLASSPDDGRLEGIEGSDIGSGGDIGGGGGDWDPDNPSDPGGGDGSGDDCDLPPPYEVPSPCA